jgi:predicted extracellular nuclease
MSTPHATSSPSSPPVWESLTLASANVLNLALPRRTFYANQDPYTDAEYGRKIQWLGGRIKTLNADVLCVQEVWDEAAIKAAVHESGLRYTTVAVPGAENNEKQNGASNTPRVGIISRLEVLELRSLIEFPSGMSVQVPEIGEHTRFERPPLQATLRLRNGQTLHVITGHLKSKRPKFLQDETGRPTEDREDPKTTARATLRSLIMRGAEAAALRCAVADILQRTHEPLVVMGDFNDSAHSVTTQIIAATGEIAFDRAARDTALFSAYEIQAMPLKRDVGYTHVHQGSPEMLDHVLVSEEFAPGSKFAIGDVGRVDIFNDHLHEGRDRSRSDHGFVRAVLRIRGN